MSVTLHRAGLGDAEKLWKMQLEAFAALYEKYGDTDTSPGAEPLEKVEARLRQPFTYFYFIRDGAETVGAIRVVDRGEAELPKRVSPIFILPRYRGKGYAQQAIRTAESIHGSANWTLDTILQEKGNCHLYEKLGYRQTGETKVINGKMTLVFYEKDR